MFSESKQQSVLMPQPPCSIVANSLAASKRAGGGLLALLLLMSIFPEPYLQAQERPIQDNSFHLEEAYNQESFVVQHISLFNYLWDSDSWAYQFTQEWPFASNFRHQFSYSVGAVRGGDFLGWGFGDLVLHYRYQAVGDGDARLASAPRLSLLLPSGDSRKGRGFGAAAVQANLPVSVVLDRRVVMHLNAGTTIVPRAQNESGERALVTEYHLSQSFIWLAHSRFNVLLETAWADTASVVGPSQTERSRELFLTPGIRWAHNFRNGLQIVPGLGWSVGAGPSAGENGPVVYLSFEHPF
ncbi:MAG: transporter [Acidobacteria bacterium]|nr:transporter [Acidobacteriota bacterium]